MNSRFVSFFLFMKFTSPCVMGNRKCPKLKKNITSNILTNKLKNMNCVLERHVATHNVENRPSDNRKLAKILYFI